MVSGWAAAEVFAEAREYYKGGLKSANKKYEDNGLWTEQLKIRAENRNKAQELAGIVIRAVRAETNYRNRGIIERGHFLYRGHVPAGNCGELATVCCYLLHETHVPSNEIALVSVYTPNPGPRQKRADHAFCLYGAENVLAMIADGTLPGSLADIANHDGLEFADVFALDPWANTCCTLGDYPNQIATKMEHWASYGKRVLWVHGPGRAGWFEANGEYKQVFGQASLKLYIC